MIGFDLALNPPKFRRTEGEGTVEGKFFQGMNGANAKLADEWVRKNLSPKASEIVGKFRKQYVKEDRKSQKFRERMEAQQEREAAFDETLQDETAEIQTEDKPPKRVKPQDAISETDLTDTDALDDVVTSWMFSRKITADAISNMSEPLHPVVRHALYSGDVQQALRLLSQHEDTGIARMARALMQVNIQPQVEVRNNLTAPDGNRVPGYYDPRTNTIFLDSVDGMNSHVVFHEFGHAAMSHAIADPNNPMTKQLTKLFGDVKDSLDTAYGATNLQEFVAEAWSNTEFQAKLNSINPMGGEITAWQRFWNIVQNMFRRLFGLDSKPIESALDRADKYIKAILSPAPESRDAELLFAATVHPRGPVAQDAFDRVASRAAKLPGVSPEWVNNSHEFIKNVFGGKAKEMAFSTMPLHALTDLAAKYIPKAPLVNRLVRQREGDENMRNQQIEAVVHFVEEWAKKHPEAVDTLNRVIYDSTIAKVDPTKPRQYYAQLYANDKKAQAAALELHDRLSKELNSINGGKEVYVRMRDTYKAMYDEIKAAIGARIDDAVENPNVRATIKNEIYRKLAEKGEIDPYFPLTRNGEYWMSYTAKDEAGQTDYIVRAFETERERNLVRAELEAAGAKDIKVFSKMSELSYKNVPPTAFVHNVLKVMEVNRPGKAEEAANFDLAMEQVLRMFLTTLPETSFAKAFHRREGISGYNRDAIRALREKSYSMSRQLSNMKYAALLGRLRQDLKSYVYKLSDSNIDNRVAKQYFEELDKRIDFAITPTPVAQWSRMAASFGFNYLLGLNVSSAMVNLSQVPLIVFPYLGGKHGLGNTSRAIREAYKIFMHSGFSREVELLGADGKTAKRRAMPSIDNIDFTDPNLPASVKKYATLSRVAQELGMLNRSQLHDALDIDGSKTPMNVVNAVSGAAFHHGERMNRQVSLMAAYSLELARLNDPKRATKEEQAMSQAQKEEAAANTAIYDTEMTNGGVGNASAPRIAQGSVGKLLFMFKTYGLAMNYLLFKTARELSSNQPPEVRRAAFKQLAGIMGTSALFAGLQGMPLFGVVAMLYNLFKEKDEEDFGTVVRTFSGEAAYKGLINHVTGLSIAERIGLSNMIIRDDPFSAGAATLADTLAQTFGGPIYGIASRVERGMTLIKDGNLERGVESILPVALANGFKATRYATEGATTIRGDPIIGDIGPWNIAAQLFGFTPAEYTKQLEINSQLKNIEKAITQRNTKLLQRIYVAMTVGDVDGYIDAYTKMSELYAKHPGLGDPGETIKNSLAQQQRITQEKFHGLTLPKKLESELRTLAAEMQ